MELTVKRRQDWAIAPTVEANLAIPELRPKLRGFRWLSEGRSARRCPSFISAKKSLISFYSPVSFSARPAREITFSCRPEEISQFANENGLQEIWARDSDYIGFSEPTGLRAFEFWDCDHWDTLFLPNGEGSFEVKLGLDLALEADQGLFVLPSRNKGIEVIEGVVTSRQMKVMNERSGMSVAFRINDVISVRRGDLLATAIIIDLRSMNPTVTLENV